MGSGIQTWFYLTQELLWLLLACSTHSFIQDKLTESLSVQCRWWTSLGKRTKEIGTLCGCYSNKESPSMEFPGGPVGKTQHFHCLESRFNPCQKRRQEDWLYFPSGCNISQTTGSSHGTILPLLPKAVGSGSPSWNGVGLWPWPEWFHMTPDIWS